MAGGPAPREELDVTDDDARAGGERSAAAAAFLAGLPGRPAHHRRVAREPVSASAIHSWCDAMGETTPAFTAEAPVAPPATLQMWTFPGLRPGRSPEAGPAEPGDLDESVRAMLAGLGYSATLAVRTDQTFESELRPGDVVVAENVYLDVTEEKRTALGCGFFVRSRTEYLTASGARVGGVILTVLHFAPAAPTSPPPGSSTTAPSSAEDAHGRPGELRPGCELGPVQVPVTATQVIAGALATRDFYPVHHDRDFARAHGNSDIVMNILTTNGLLARVVGEWTGATRLRRLVTTLRAPASPGEVLRISGRVEASTGPEVVVCARAETGSAIHAEAVATMVS
jgi:acyl dehydratase